MLDKWYYPILCSVYKTLKWNGWKFLINIHFVANAENWETANMQCINFSQEWKWPNQNMMYKWYENNAIKNNFHSFLSIYILCDFRVHFVPSCVWQRYPMTRNLEGIIVSHPFLCNYYNQQKSKNIFACIITIWMHHELRHMEKIYEKYQKYLQENYEIINLWLIS